MLKCQLLWGNYLTNVDSDIKSDNWVYICLMQEIIFCLKFESVDQLKNMDIVYFEHMNIMKIIYFM